MGGGEGGAPAAGPVAAADRLALAHDLQASALGGLSPAMARRLDRLAGEAQNRRAAKASSGWRLKAKAGATLVRDCGGRTHQVEVQADGTFVWNGQVWRSLSAISREITGTRRNGPAFFGLREAGDGAA